MTVTMEQVRQVLEPEEPDYAAAARLGPGSLPHLRELAEGADPMLASKAVYAASLLDGDQGGAVVAGAARSADPVLRVAAAAPRPTCRPTPRWACSASWSPTPTPASARWPGPRCRRTRRRNSSGACGPLGKPHVRGTTGRHRERTRRRGADAALLADAR